MQFENWTDLRFLLALHRHGTLIGAANELNVDQTTVTRRLRALEKITGSELYEHEGTEPVCKWWSNISTSSCPAYINALQFELSSELRPSTEGGTRDRGSDANAAALERRRGGGRELREHSGTWLYCVSWASEEPAHIIPNNAGSYQYAFLTMSTWSRFRQLESDSSQWQPKRPSDRIHSRVWPKELVHAVEQAEAGCACACRRTICGHSQAAVRQEWKQRRRRR